MNIRPLILFFAVLPMLAAPASADPGEQGQDAKPVPGDRQAMLQALGALKHRQARLPLPPASGEAESRVVNNGRMRQLYLPPSWSGRRGGSRGGEQLPGGYELATQLFWIVSRVNNCHYCLGHQEGKLQRAGMDEPSLLALDTDWGQFSPDRQAAFAFARKLTFAPHAIETDDIESLRPHFSDAEILRIVYLVGRYNATNRWTDSLGIPQEAQRDFSSQLGADQLAVPSKVAVERFPERPAPGSFDAWRQQLQAARQRKPRLDLAALLPAGEPSPAAADQPVHLRLLAAVAGPAAADAVGQAGAASAISPTLKQMIALVAAAEDGAWYMQGRALDELAALGIGERAAYELATRSPNAGLSDAQRAALDVASLLTREPLAVHDGHIAQLRRHHSPHEVAEIVHHVGVAALLNRLTETIALP